MKMKDAVLQLLNESTIKWGFTATAMAKVLNVNPSSLSSLLKKMTDAGDVVRENGRGPRGGYMYWTNERLIECGHYNCKNLKRETAMFCASCRLDYMEDPDSFK